MLKYKFTKKINFFIIKLLFCSSSFSCFAGSSNINEMTPEQKQAYISSSINAFFQIKQSNEKIEQPSKKDIVNHLFSPFGSDSCLATFGRIQLPNSEAKQKIDDKLISLGIDPDMPLCSADESKLKLLTAVLTRDDVKQEGSDRLNALNVFLGEFILNPNHPDYPDYPDYSDYPDYETIKKKQEEEIAKKKQEEEIIKKKKEEFKEKIKNALIQKFKGNFNLDNSVLWKETNDKAVFLNIISVIKFQDDWRDEYFDYIGSRTFYTKDNQQIQTDFMIKNIPGSPKIDTNSDWQAVRLFCKEKYALDIILPAENDQSTNEEKAQIMYSLISKLNQNKINFEQKTSVIMPKFEYEQKNLLTDYMESTLEGIIPDYGDFLKYPHIKDIIAAQECYIKIDEKGVTAEAITIIDAADGASPRANTYFVVDRSYFFVLSEYVDNTDDDDIMEIKKIIMIGEVGNPSEHNE